MLSLHLYKKGEFACFNVALNPVTMIVCQDVNVGVTVSSYMTFHHAGYAAM